MVKVSVLIPVLNGAKYLPSLLDSTYGQKGINEGDLEVAVGIHPKTTDNSREIAEAYGCIIVRGGLPAVGRNKAAEATTGDIVVSKDVDSIFPHDYFLSSAIKEMERRKLDVATPLYYAVHQKNGFAGKRYDWYIKIANDTTEKAENTNNPLMMNCMFARRRVHEALRGFDKSLEFGEDAEFAKRAKEAGYTFGILRDKECKEIGFNMRKAEESLLEELKFLAKNVYFTTGRRFGHEFKRGKLLIRYWPKNQ